MNKSRRLLFTALCILATVLCATARAPKGTGLNAPVSLPVLCGDPASAGITRTPYLKIGEPLENLNGRFGKAHKVDGNHHTWNSEFCILTANVSDSRLVTWYNVVNMSGKRLLTPDGIVLGEDTLSTLRMKLKGRVLPKGEDFGMVEGVWYLNEVVLPPAGSSGIIEYGWYLNDGVPEDHAIISRYEETREMFRDVPVSGYSVGKSKRK